MAQWWCSPSMCLKELRKTTKILSQDSQYPGRDSSSLPTEHKSGALPLDKFVRFVILDTEDMFFFSFY
jgi:hypothetical protein